MQQENSNGRWKKAEHDRFMKGLEKYGRDWLKIQKYVRTRSLAQVRSHAQKCFKNMSQQDVEAYFAEDKDYAVNSFGRIKMNPEKKKNIELPTIHERFSSKQVIQKPSGQNLLDIFKKALEIDKNLPEEKKIGTEFSENMSEQMESGDSLPENKLRDCVNPD